MKLYIEEGVLTMEAENKEEERMISLSRVSVFSRLVSSIGITKEGNIRVNRIAKEPFHIVLAYVTSLNDSDYVYEQGESEEYKRGKALEMETILKNNLK